MAQLNFDATQVEPDTGFDTVPAGWYNVMMDESDLKPTKDGAGTYLQARFNILDGQYKGRKLFARLNIRNANAQAQEIALRQLSAIGHAVGVLHIQDSQQLHGLPLKVKVKIRKGDDNYEDQNEIISYKNINEQVETVGSGQGAGAPPPQGFQQPSQQQPQGFQQPPMQQPVQQPVQQQPQFQPQQQPVQQQPVQQQPFQQPQAQPQQFQQPPAEQPQQQPWAQPPLATAPQGQPQEQHPFQTQQQPPAQPTQQQPWNGGAAPPQGQPQQPVQQQPVDPNAGAAAQAQQAPPPWANQGQPQG
jgi:hypothetical protein